MSLSPSVLFARGLRCKSDTPPQTPTKTHQELIQDAIKVMLERSEEGDFTAAGLPDRRRLAKVAGLNVTAEDLIIAWQAVNDAAGA